MNYRIKWLSSICYVSMMLGLATSCAEGVDDNERFSAGVSNTQLEAPKLTDENLKVQVNSDGSESVDVSWPVVLGAGGYLANVDIVNDPTNPISVIKDLRVDGCHFAFPREVDTKYEITVSTLGNEKLNNKGSVDASSIAYSTMLPATTIPVDTDFAQFIANNIPDGDTNEIAFELIAGAEYTITTPVDLKVANVTIRGDRYNRPLIVLAGEGTFINQNGLKIRNINFDMSDAPLTSLISLSADPSPMFSTEALGIKALASNVKDGFIVQNPISLESCNLRNVPSSILWTNKIGEGNSGWALTNFRIDDCVVQFDKKNSKPAINLEDNWGMAGIRMMTLSNSTFYNLANIKCRFLRYGARTNPEQVYGPGATTDHTISHCTFYKTFTGDQFANNMDNSKLTATIDHCIFYDIMRLDQYCFRSGTTQVSSDNVSWLAGDEPKLHSNILKMSEEIDPNFAGPTGNMFDLDLANGGVSFRPQAAVCVEKKIGDPRWFE
ncbi:MAG: DUF4957 domain-containing protein [Duncaniella sp.]|nr:DUF4957 domain-containing protein [Duncaniella sp.]